MGNRTRMAVIPMAVEFCIPPSLLFSSTQDWRNSHHTCPSFYTVIVPQRLRRIGREVHAALSSRDTKQHQQLRTVSDILLVFTVYSRCGTCCSWSRRCGCRTQTQQKRRSAQQHQSIPARKKWRNLKQTDTQTDRQASRRQQACTQTERHAQSDRQTDRRTVRQSTILL